MKCSKCPTEIVWLRHHTTGNKAPIEVVPAANGNIIINRVDLIYRFATKEEKERAKAENKNLYLNHFSTCEFSKEFKKQKSK